jgi:hypothetical protein
MSVLSEGNTAVRITQAARTRRTTDGGQGKPSQKELRSAIDMGELSVALSASLNWHRLQPTFERLAASIGTHPLWPGLDPCGACRVVVSVLRCVRPI